jgi:L-lysine exporter family protein LysE/ArgO
LIVSFLVGASVCFASTLPFGPINLTVVKITVEKSHLRGFEVAVAAAAVETFQVLLAVWFGLVISAFLEDNVIFRATVATVFLLIGVVVPFWIIALAAINDYTDLAFQGLELALFLAGVFVGKVLALTGFITVSNYLKTHLDQSSRLVNNVLGSVLIVIGVIQWIRLLLTV